METTLVLLKPSCVQRLLIGEIIHRFERRGLHIAGLKMMQLDEPILREHYAHLADRPFFPSLAASMMASPIVPAEHRSCERLHCQCRHRTGTFLPPRRNLRLHRSSPRFHLRRRGSKVKTGALQLLSGDRIAVSVDLFHP